MTDLTDIYVKEEGLLNALLNNESSVSWQRYNSSLVANAILIAAAGVLLSTRSTAAVEFNLRLVTFVIGSMGALLNWIFRLILIRSQAIVLTRWELLAELEGRIKDTDDESRKLNPIKVWGEKDYEKRLENKLKKERNPAQIMTMMTWLPCLFIAIFLTIAFIGILLTRAPATACS